MSDASKFAPWAPLSILVHAGNPRMARIPELDIRAMPECEGGGWYLPLVQAQRLVDASNLLSGEVTDAMNDAGFAALDEYEQLKTDKVFPRKTLPAHVFLRMLAASFSEPRLAATPPSPALPDNPEATTSDEKGICNPILCSAELDRFAAAEIAIDEVMTILERHGLPVPDELSSMSKRLSAYLQAMDGIFSRYARLTRVRNILTAAFPMDDADLIASPIPTDTEEKAG